MTLVDINGSKMNHSIGLKSEKLTSLHYFGTKLLFQLHNKSDYYI